MGNIIRGLVQGIGITPYSQLPECPTIFTETAVAETICIPEQKPDIEQLISVAADAQILSVRLVETASGTSDEGQILRGYKLIVELKLRQKVKYVADEPTQSVHAAHFEKVITSIFVVVDKNIADLYKHGKVVVKPYIEDIYAVKKGLRKIFKNIIILVNVTTI